MSAQHDTREVGDEMALPLRPTSACEERRLIGRYNTSLPRSPAQLRHLADYADRIHDARARRALFLPTELLSEPAWDILLALFAATARGGTLSTTRACDASGAPMATALRWLGTLTQLGLVETIPCPTDLRVRNLRLTPKGLATMVNLLTELDASST